MFYFCLMFVFIVCVCQTINKDITYLLTYLHSTQYFIEILQTPFQSPQMHHPLPTHSLIFSKTKLNASAPNFHHLILLIRFFFHLPHLQSWLISFQPLWLKFTNLFMLLKVNNVPWIPSQLSFWNSPSMNLVQSSQILSISLFLKKFSIVIQTSSCPAFSQKTISIYWWSQQLLSNFKPQLHFQNSRKSCCLQHSISPAF